MDNSEYDNDFTIDVLVNNDINIPKKEISQEPIANEEK